MTEIEKQALALVNEAAADFHVTPWESIDRRSFLEDVLCRAIEQHEAFRQEVSDAVEDYCGYVPPDSPSHPITRFIIPKPDLLIEALIMGGIVNNGAAEMAADIRQALAARGLKIVEVSDD